MFRNETAAESAGSVGTAAVLFSLENQISETLKLQKFHDSLNFSMWSILGANDGS